MKVLIVNPRVAFNVYFAGTPLGSLAVGSYLKEKGYDVRIYDRAADKRKLAKVFAEFKPDAVGISLIASVAIPDALRVSKYCREQGVPVIMGGITASFVADALLKEDATDYIVLGEGEIPMYELLRKLESGEPVGEMLGIAYRDESGQIQIMPERPFADLNEFPTMDWSLIKPERYWQSHISGMQRAIYLFRSKGCPGRCTFCFNPAFHHSERRVRSDEDVCEDIRVLVTEYHADGIIFGDECFCTRSEELLNFCAKLKAMNLPVHWGCQTRTTTTREELQAMYDAGCRAVFFGVESGSPKIQKKVHKNLSLNGIERVFRDCQEIGIYTTASIVLGLPTETEEDLKLTIALMTKIRANYMHLPFFSPIYPSELWDECVAEKKLTPPRNLDEWSKIYLSGWFSSALNGGVIFGEVPLRELQVAQCFAFWLCFAQPGGNNTSLIYACRRIFVDFFRFVLQQGFVNGFRNLFQLAQRALIVFWNITAYPKIRKKYGLYVKNFRG